MQTHVPLPGSGGGIAVLPHGLVRPAVPATAVAVREIDYAALADGNATFGLGIELEDGSQASVEVVVPYGSDEAGVLNALNTGAKDLNGGGMFGVPLDYARFGFAADVAVVGGLRLLRVSSKNSLRLYQYSGLPVLGFDFDPDAPPATGTPERIQDTLVRHVYDDAGTSLAAILAELAARKPGFAFLAGSDEPAEDLGDDGDLYFASAAPSFWQKVAGTWFPLANVIAPTPGGNGAPPTASNIPTSDGSTVQAVLDLFEAQFNGAGSELDAHDARLDAAEASLGKVLLAGTKVITAQPGEAGLRAALAEAFGYLAFPSATIVVDVPAQPDIALVDGILIDQIEAPRVAIRFAAPTAQPAPTAITAAVAGPAMAAGQPTYDLTFSLAGAHTLAVGQSVWLTAKSTLGSPATPYQALGGFHQVVAVPTATSVTLRIPSWLSLTGLTTLGLNGQASSVAFTLDRSNVNLRTPVNNPGSVPAFDVNASKLLCIANLGIVGNGGTAGTTEWRGLLIRGASTVIASTGRIGVRGCGVGIIVDDGSIARFGGAPAALASDSIVACNGNSGHGFLVQPAAYGSLRSVTDGFHFSGNGGTGSNSNGVSAAGGQCDIVSLTTTPLSGTIGGNHGVGVFGNKQSRLTVRFHALYLPIAANNLSATATQVFADGLTLIDFALMNASIPISPAANTPGNNNALIQR